MWRRMDVWRSRECLWLRWTPSVWAISAEEVGRASCGYGEQVRMLQGGIGRTTNNRMEVMAAIEGLRCATRPCEVEVVTD
jgi:ribonuclease HI